ncbi:hypothetical protein [Nocardia xishanensis]
MTGGQFTAPTKALVAARAGYMCTNPECNRLLVGPEVSGPDASMKTRIGEVAHIYGHKPGSARHDPLMAMSNVLILPTRSGCASCVTSSSTATTASRIQRPD